MAMEGTARLAFKWTGGHWGNPYMVIGNHNDYSSESRLPRFSSNKELQSARDAEGVSNCANSSRLAGSDFPPAIWLSINGYSFIRSD